MSRSIRPPTDPAAILSNVPELTAPQFRVLKSSDLGRIYFVEAQEGWYVLRVPLHRGLGINRRTEMDIHRAMAEAGFAPPIIWCNPVSGALLTAWQRGGVWRQNPCAGEDLRQLARLLRGVHTSGYVAPRLDYHARLRLYLKDASRHFEASVLAPVKDAVDELMHYIYGLDVRPGLCHHDPLRPNIVCDEHAPVLIDWEYAALGDIRLDLAACCLDHELDEHARGVLLSAYDPTIKTSELPPFVLLCRLLEELWYGAQGEAMKLGSLLDDITKLTGQSAS